MSQNQDSRSIVGYRVARRPAGADAHPVKVGSRLVSCSPANWGHRSAGLPLLSRVADSLASEFAEVRELTELRLRDPVGAPAPRPIRDRRAALPIYQTTAYVFEDADHARALFNLQTVGFIYSA